MFVDYYSILGIEKKATLDEIKKAFKGQAKIWHPDKNSSAEANERMQLLNEAYLILTDLEARKRYDEEYKLYFQAHQHKEKSKNNIDEEYNIVDPTLNHWMQNAKKQAKDIVDELKKTGKRAGKAFIERVILGIIRYIIFGAVIFFLFKNCQKEKKIEFGNNQKDIVSIDTTITSDTNASSILVSSKYTPEDVKNKLTSYFDAINNRQFFTIQSYFAPQLISYFPYKNVSSEFAANDVIDFWSNQKQPCRIFYEDANFNVIDNFENFTISGNLLEQSSLFKERIPFWIESRITYKFNKNLQLISLSGQIINKQPDLVRIFEIDDASIDDIRERENTNDFRKYFNLIYKTIDIKPSVAKKYIQAIREVYGSQLLVYYKYNYYSFEEFTLNKSLLYQAYLNGVKSVDRSSSGNKVVTIFDF